MKVCEICDQRSLLDYQDELVEIYQRAFGEEPWNEVFAKEEVLDWFFEMISCSSTIVLLLFHKQKLVGATFCVNADLQHEVWQYLPEGVSEQDVIYLAESFIDPAQQRQGFGAFLHQERLTLAQKKGFKYALQRTSEDSGMFVLIRRTGFEIVGRQNVISLKKINGAVKEVPDERIISLKKF